MLVYTYLVCACVFVVLYDHNADSAARLLLTPLASGVKSISDGWQRNLNSETLCINGHFTVADSRATSRL